MAYLTLKTGEIVCYRGRSVVVGDPVEGDRITVRDPATGRTEVAAIVDLSPCFVEETKPQKPPPLQSISKEAWAEAKRKHDVIAPLAQKGRVTNEEAKAVARTIGTSLRTVRRMLRRFLKERQLTAFLPRHHLKGGRGSKRLESNQERIADELIRTRFLHEQRLTVRDLMMEIRRRCKQEGVRPPSENTVRNRISAIDRRILIERREGRKAAEDETRPVRQHFEAGGPMEVIQIDHTVVDAIIVDEETRQTIGRAYVTYAVDVFSRCIVGLYVTLDPPDTIAVAMCFTRAVLPKEKWLRDLGIDMPWPVWGKPTRVLVDNARELDSRPFRRGLAQYGIILEFRPVGQPWFGGHVESSNKTQMRRVHTLPGTTKFNPAAKGKYDAEGNAILTLRELEKCLILNAIQYNNAIHSALQRPPIAQYMAGVLGDEITKRYGYPPRIIDEVRFWLSFLPYEERTIQKYGVQINFVRYHSEILSQLLRRGDTKGKLFKIAFDKRHMRTVYLIDDEVGDYFEIPTWNRTRRDFSWWEVDRARKLAAEKGHKEFDEDLIFKIMDEREQLIREARDNTKTARREVERRRQNARSRPPGAPQALPPPIPPPLLPANDDATAAAPEPATVESAAEAPALADSVEETIEVYETEEWK